MLPLAASIAAIGVASAIAYGVYIGGSSITANQQSKHKTVALMQRAAYVLMTEGTDADSDGTKEVVAFGASANAPTGGGAIPTSSVAPKLDGWGNAIGYCPYDNGTATALANHIAGDNPGNASSVSFILISPGKSGKFDTTCAQAQAGTPQGDDFVQGYTVGQALKGGSGIPGFGDPVPDAAQLALVPSPATGEIRLVQATGTLMEWTGSAWQQVGGATAAAAANFLAPVEYMTDLPPSGNTNGDLRVVIAENAIYAWNGAPISAWLPHLSDSTTTQGALYGWGQNSNGGLGDGTTTTHGSPPVQVGAMRNWKQVAGQNLGTVAIKTDGTIWSWGWNAEGENGLGDSGNSRSSPTQVGALANWRQVATGRYHAAAVKTDGSLWCWGKGDSGDCAASPATWKTSPIQVGALTTWKQVAAGWYHTLAIQADGTLWDFGSNQHGQLGLGNTTDISTPAQVAAGTTWKLVAGGYYHTIAIKTDGTLWTWGWNDKGQLGQNNISDRSLPTQVGGAANWKQAAGGDKHSVAIKTDGTMWAWGYNNSGQLGLGDTTDRSSPVQVGGLNNYANWAQAQAGLSHTIAIKTDGTLWSWGSNSAGQLAQSGDRSSPSQITGFTDWKSAGAGYEFSFAIR